jgi:hypothetical protein
MMKPDVSFPSNSRLWALFVAVMFFPLMGLPSQSWLSEEIVCNYWVAPQPEGDDSNPGTFSMPWATLEHASEMVPDNHCTVWFKSGLYSGTNNPERRFTTQTTFKAVDPYKAIFENSGIVIELDGAMNMVFEGFEFRHSGSGASQYVVIMDRRDDILWTEQVIFRNNIFHDSYNNDLLKIHNGSRFVTIEGNIFYNQGDSDQHIDVNSVTDITIQDNIFFNDFSGSGRANTSESKHFIVVKDSNENSDGLLGSRRVDIRRNIFLNWEGDEDTMVKIGNDGKPYHEARDVTVENNLFIGNSPILTTAAFGIRGARDILFNNNTIVGDLPSKAYAIRVTITDLNPINEDITFINNIWSDPTGSMGVDLEGGSGEFSDGDPAESANVLLENNLYWNGGQEIPPGELVSPLVDDPKAVLEDPLLETDQDQLVLPRWTGNTFLSGNRSIRQEFIRLVERYGSIPAGSAAIGKADPILAPVEDILGNERSASPDLGAYEYRIHLTGVNDLHTIALQWTPIHEAEADSLMITYRVNGITNQIAGIPVSTSTYTLTDLNPYSVYVIFLTAHAEDGSILSRSNQVALLTTDIKLFLPAVFWESMGHLSLLDSFLLEGFVYEHIR